MSIAFLGLGAMGVGIAANLLGSGRELTVWNRSSGRDARLVSAGAASARSPLEAASDAAVVFSMLSDDAAFEAVLGGDRGLLAGLPSNAIHVSMSTISVATADRAAAAHRAHGQRFVSCPVFGRPDAAAAAKLFVLAAGAADDLDEVEPLLGCIGQRTFRVGETPSQANLVKLCGNFTIMAAIEAMAEGMALAEKGGVGKALLYEILTGTLFDSAVYRNYGRILVDGAYKPAGFKAPLGLKDMRLAAEAAEKHRVPMPLLSLVRDQLIQTIAREGEDIDWSGVGKTVAGNAGL